MIYIFVFAQIAIVALSGSAFAQTGPTDDDLTLRPGDRVVWSAPDGGHSVLFGGLPVLTALADVQLVFDFSPALAPPTSPTPKPGGESAVGGSPMLTAVVKANAETAGISTIDFTCGIHRGGMRSKKFKIVADGKPSREIRIKPDPNGLNWLMETSHGDVIIDARAVETGPERLADHHKH